MVNHKQTRPEIKTRPAEIRRVPANDLYLAFNIQRFLKL
jgi:hypothetical protein